MRRTIYLPDELAARVDEYLKIHHDQTFSSLVRRALDREIPPANRRSILDLVGFVSVEPDQEDERFRDRPEDRFVDWFDGPPR